MDASPTLEAPPEADAQAILSNTDADVAWLAPAHRPPPAQALRRIKALCEQTPELYGALLIVVASHQGLRHDILASAVKRFRPDLDEFSSDDVVGLLRACWNGGWQGFDAVLRSRRSRDRKGKAAAPSWLKPDD